MNSLAASALVAASALGGTGSDGCLVCHDGIEEMHPWEAISCVGCHGGDASATSKEGAHVAPRREVPNDERVLPLDDDLPFRRFRNPTDLRVVAETCGTCHPDAVSNVKKSLHGTTAGHLSDGLYENGVTKDRRARFSLFPVADEDGVVPSHAYARLGTLPPHRASGPLDRIARHFTDVPRKSCAQCHLYAEGRAVRGRLGMDGDYRGAGCAACHVTYSDDGLSRSGDPAIDKFEPGHPRKHLLTTEIPVTTCVHCHYGDASIGLSFRGLAQLPPGVPAGPDVPGTTKARLHGAFYLNDPTICPPDVHFERGMHCIDCHTARDVMGDGNVYGFMEDAVEIECADCHGTFEEPSRLETSRGARLEHLRREGDRVILRSKVTGKDHPVPQAAFVLDRRRPEFNERAAAAMTREHANLECYACHAGWVPNFFGFHFDRNESFTQLDLLSGERTPGRVTTQEKVFATFRPLYLGWNGDGKVAPYMVGFSTTGTAHDAEGVPRFVQQMPVTAAGLSGMTLVHHQTHTVRAEARRCVECHRSPQTLGLGSPNYSLARSFAFASGRAGVEVVALDRKNLDASKGVATLPLEGAGRIALDLEPLQGHARRAFVVANPTPGEVAGEAGDMGMSSPPAEARPGRPARRRAAASERRGIAVVDLENPVFPRIAEFVGTADPRDAVLAASTLFVADGKGGVATFDVSGRAAKPLGRVGTSEARSFALAWPHLFVADGPGGLLVLDVGDPKSMREIARLDTNGSATEPDDARGVALLFQYSRPDPDARTRTSARHLAALACGTQGARLVDVTDPANPKILAGEDDLSPRGRRFDSASVEAVALGSVYDLGSEGGDIPSEENDYLYLVVQTERENPSYGLLLAIRVTDPTRPEFRGTARSFRRGVSGVALARLYNAPFLQHFAVVTGDGGAMAIDVTKSDMPQTVATIPVPGATAVALEAFPFDRLVAEDGRPLKDISHPNSRYLSLPEIERVLRAPIGSPPSTSGASGQGGR